MSLFKLSNKVLLLGVLIVVPLLLILMPDESNSNHRCNFSINNDHEVIKANLKDLELGLEVIKADQDKAIGLSDRECLSEYEGMIFVYDNEARRCMWMKNMSFPIDIVWLNSDYKINSVAENVQPSTYPNSFCGEARYVIEVNAGFINRFDWRVGDELKVY